MGYSSLNCFQKVMDIDTLLKFNQDMFHTYKCNKRYVNCPIGEL